MFFLSHQILLRSINAVLIVLSVLELCLVISSAVLAIKALKTGERGQMKVRCATLILLFNNLFTKSCLAEHILLFLSFFFYSLLFEFVEMNVNIWVSELLSNTRNL